MKNPLNDLPGYALRRAASSMMADLLARLEQTGFRYSDVAVVMLIGANDGITASAIGRELDIQRANLVRILNRLESENIVARTPLDGKSHAINLTQEGQELLGRLGSIITQYEQSLMDKIPKKHRPHLLPALLALWQ